MKNTAKRGVKKENHAISRGLYASIIRFLGFHYFLVLDRSLESVGILACGNGNVRIFSRILHIPFERVFYGEQRCCLYFIDNFELIRGGVTRSL